MIFHKHALLALSALLLMTVIVGAGCARKDPKPHKGYITGTCAVDKDCPAGGRCESKTCIPAGCGNGVLERDYEECDDGNLFDGDGCNDRCGTEPDGLILEIDGLK